MISDDIFTKIFVASKRISVDGVSANLVVHMADGISIPEAILISL